MLTLTYLILIIKHLNMKFTRLQVRVDKTLEGLSFKILLLSGEFRGVTAALIEGLACVRH